MSGAVLQCKDYRDVLEAVLMGSLRAVEFFGIERSIYLGLFGICLRVRNLGRFSILAHNYALPGKHQACRNQGSKCVAKPDRMISILSVVSWAKKLTLGEQRW